MELAQVPDDGRAPGGLSAAGRALLPQGLEDLRGTRRVWHGWLAKLLSQIRQGQVLGTVSAQTKKHELRARASTTPGAMLQTPNARPFESARARARTLSTHRCYVLTRKY